MQSFYPARFEREMGCTEAEWLGWLPRAIGAREWELGPQTATARIGASRLLLTWHVAEPRRIALIQIPRLLVGFDFGDLQEAERYAFMKRFDLYTQRGGG